GSGGSAAGSGGGAGHAGGAGGGSVCPACMLASAVACPADVATASMCPSEGASCCAGDQQWHCGNCVAETCHWTNTCSTGAGGSSGGAGGHAGSSGGGGGNGDGGVACNATTLPCSAGHTCIMGGTCAESCTPDGGAQCPSGTTCKSTSGFCTGAACAAIQVWVCR
ncbi:MAG TPA: hypothetical protein VIK30_10640, partial [Polyangia bacterium]